MKSSLLCLLLAASPALCVPAPTPRPPKPIPAPLGVFEVSWGDSPGQMQFARDGTYRCFLVVAGVEQHYVGTWAYDATTKTLSVREATGAFPPADGEFWARWSVTLGRRDGGMGGRVSPFQAELVMREVRR